MFQARKPRGATVIRQPLSRGSSRRYLVGSAAAVLALAGALMLWTVQWRGAERSDPPQIVTPASEVEAEADAETLREVVPRGVAVVPALPPPPPVHAWKEHTVRGGDTLSAIFKRAGFSSQDLFEVINQAQRGRELGRLHPGETIGFQRDERGELLAVRHIRSALETIEYRRGADGFESQALLKQPEIRSRSAIGEIDSSLFLAARAAGMSQNLTMEVANIFGGVIDFYLDPRKGDSMQVIYNELFVDGKKYRDGEVIAASFTNRGRTFSAYRYEDLNGDVGYYNEDGVSMRKAFLLAPLDFTRISSNFNPRRLHPIYKTRRPHRGTDYAAPRGTPVYAAGDGKVIKAGYTKANGNYVFIQHGQQYMTRYLHLHKRKVRAGQRVSQNQIIGTVGSTGAATGPHLHYEFLVNGVHRNPRTIHKKLPKAKSLPAAEMSRFRAAIAESYAQLAALEGEQQVAASSGPVSSAAAGAP